MLLVVAGMIGGGKSSLTEIISNEFGGNAYFEETNSPILNKFYTASPEEMEAKRYAFLLQLEFLNSRFKMIKNCLLEGDNPKVNVLDRSIYEDAYFMEINRRLGKISDEEATIYLGLMENMLEEIEELPKKAPDLCIYLKGSFETFLNRINKRNRGMETDTDTYDYFKLLHKHYDDWVFNSYKASPVLVIDIDKYDYVENEEDRKEVLDLIYRKLEELNLI